MSTEQEYDTQHAHSMLDDPDADADGSDPSPDQMHGHFPPHYGDQAQRQQQIPTSSGYYQQPVQGHPQMMPHQQQQQIPGASGAPNGGGQFDMIDPSDPMLDADPFGLSASMHYNTSYSFEQSAQR